MDAFDAYVCVVCSKQGAWPDGRSATVRQSRSAYFAQRVAVVISTVPRRGGSGRCYDPARVNPVLLKSIREYAGIDWPIRCSAGEKQSGRDFRFRQRRAGTRAWKLREQLRQDGRQQGFVIGQVEIMIAGSFRDLFTSNCKYPDQIDSVQKHQRPAGTEVDVDRAVGEATVQLFELFVFVEKDGWLCRFDSRSRDAGGEARVDWPSAETVGSRDVALRGGQPVVRSRTAGVKGTPPEHGCGDIRDLRSHAKAGALSYGVAIVTRQEV